MGYSYELSKDFPGGQGLPPNVAGALYDYLATIGHGIPPANGDDRAPTQPEPWPGKDLGPIGSMGIRRATVCHSIPQGVGDPHVTFTIMFDKPEMVAVVTASGQEIVPVQGYTLEVYRHRNPNHERPFSVYTRAHEADGSSLNVSRSVDRTELPGKVLAWIDRLRALRDTTAPEIGQLVIQALNTWAGDNNAPTVAEYAQGQS